MRDYNSHNVCLQRWKRGGVIIGLINYPRFPTTKEKLRETAEEIARLCKEQYKQNRISIKYQDQTIMLE